MTYADEFEASIVSVTLADVNAELVRWVWPGRMPIGKLVTLDGDPALGKSTVMLDLAARISTGTRMPDGHQLDGPADTILLSAEDGLADTIRPRLDAAGGDARRVHVFTEVSFIDEEGQYQTRPPQIPADTDRLEVLIRRHGAVLVVIDVLNAFLAGSVDSHRDQDVRRALHRLSIVAERTGCCIVVLRHLAKSGGPKAIYRGGGSIGIIGAARAGLIVGTDPEDEERRILAVAKSNLARIPTALAYRLVSDPERGCARVEWLGTTGHSADDLVAAPSDAADDGADAKSVLAEILEGGPLWAKDAFEAMAAAGFSKDQAKRAKAKLGVRTFKVGRPGDAESGWKWEVGRPREHEESEGRRIENPLPSHPSVLPSEESADLFEPLKPCDAALASADL